MIDTSITQARDPLHKQVLRSAWRGVLDIQSLLTARRRGGTPRVWYGGARSGSIGGPLVKVQRLQSAFPEHRLDYNLVYTLSNAPYLSRRVLTRLKRRGVPIVTNQNGVFYPAWYDGDWRGRNADMAHAYHLADHVFWQSKFCRNCADRFLGQREGPGEVLYNAVDTQRFSPAASRSRSRFTFLVSGKFGVDLFYRLAATLEGLAATRTGGLDAHLRIAGWMTPSVTEQTRRRIAALGLEKYVTITGPYSQADAPTIYQTADAYVMLKHNDPCPNTVLEALACGLPVVYSKSGGVPELVGDDAGIGLECMESFEQPYWPDAESVGAAMVTVADQCDKYAAAARARALRLFDIDLWLARHRQRFDELIGNPT